MTATLCMRALYRDLEGARTWLVDALGFDVVVEWPDNAGQLVLAELRRGDAVVVIERDTRCYQLVSGADSVETRTPLLCLGDAHAVDSLFLRVAAVGAAITRAPETTNTGHRRFDVVDPEGHLWAVGSYELRSWRS